ncbi:MAG: hypothetical protein SAJ12_13630 [Jaaginema sp. PMC 1079.18]|nr:hypothetical protein [Jaaginema sp. PMC 1080.18]MEC4852023.1 hypothetical protein [Jaaginema sp. PMC 1079.18]MEC4866115.1 hypothetical protein [Jaaginema sp. PMC 1078.18]
MPPIRKILTSFAIALLLLVAACDSSPPSRFDQAQQESTQPKTTAVSSDAKAGGDFNRFFPKADGLVFSQEKKGFAQAKLKQEGAEVATLSIVDLNDNSQAIGKYKDSSETLSGYPVVDVGSTGTGLLVKNRFQVKVLSRDSSFSAEDRRSWLKKFDLKGLETMANGTGDSNE